MKISLFGYTVPQSEIKGTSKGIARYIYYLSKELLNLGNEVELFVRNDFKPKEEWIKTVFAPKFSWIAYPFFLFPKTLTAKADVYHADYVNTGSPMVLAGKRPTVVAIHDAIPFTYNPKDLKLRDKIIWKWYLFNFKIIQKADALIVVSNNAKQEALKHTNVPEEKIHVIYYGIDHDRIFPDKKETNNDVIKVGYIGGLESRKNFGMLFSAMEKIIGEYQNVEFHVGGYSKVVEEYKKRNVPRVYFHGEIKFEDVNKFLNSLDIFAYPSLQEGFGFAPVEAMACGLPVVAVNGSTMPELVGDSGLLVKPTADGIGNGIRKFIEDASLRKKYGKKAAERAKMFTWEKCAKETLDLYGQLMKK